jgi:hypothetical protein
VEVWLMGSGREAILNYQAAAARNRDIFLLNHAYAFHAFGGLNDNFEILGHILQTGRNANGKTYVSFVPFLLLMQRQSLSAFQLLWSHQSYQAWVLLRPALESALIMGKWVDSTANARLWERRREEPDKYRNEYSGKKLISKSLPEAAAIQSVLGRINDDFMHLNADYYSRHMQMRPEGSNAYNVLIQYFDADDDHAAHLLAFLHLLGQCQDSVLGLLQAVCPGFDDVKHVLPIIEKALKTKATALVADRPESKAVLKQLGLWTFA